ncbi:MAG: KamA family radical SAM protein [Planctomycetes bacterium]|nr:KamA family radical SAM protein [Planctomycetota bacterium]
MEEWQRLLAEGINNAKQWVEEFPDQDPLVAKRVDDVFQLRVNKYWMDLMKSKGNPEHLMKQVAPDERELEDTFGFDDPLNEEAQSPVPGLVHRYPDRVLFYVAHQCAFYCRYCTRKRKVSDPESISRAQLQRAYDYIRAHTEIRDVVLSGGDPMMLKDDPLVDIIRNLREIPHVEIIRIGTRIPSALPQRITPELVARLKPYNPIWMMVHFDHPDELTPEAIASLNRMADAGFPLMNQTVLLKGVNDNVEALAKLFKGLLMARCRPYYLYQADITKGTNHFRTTVEKGLEIMKGLRGWISGIAIPHYVIDAPGGGGKIPMVPNYVESWDDGKLVFKNFKGTVHEYPEVVEDPADPVVMVRNGPYGNRGVTGCEGIDVD